MAEKVRVLFMGTPDFAADSLRRLAGRFEVAAAVSQPDRPKGRGYGLLPTPVRAAALELGIPCLQPESLRGPEIAGQLALYRPDVIAVVAYGKILPQAVLDIPALGCVNLHPSLLPKYRGAAPLQWAVISGERETGVTTMYMDAGMDTGDIIYSYRTQIGENETAGELRRRVAPIGAELLCDTIDAVAAGTAPRVRQDPEKATYAPPIKKEMGRYMKEMSAKRLHDLVRGLSPSPGVFGFAGEKRLKICATRLRPEARGEPGTVELSGGKLCLYCAEGAVSLETVQPEGGRPMDAAAFYNGNRFSRLS